VLTICSDAFLPLGNIQAKAMGIAPNFMIVPHPIGGLEEHEVVERHAAAAWPRLAAWLKDVLGTDPAR
jgi:hypothetical protein